MRSYLQKGMKIVLLNALYLIPAAVLAQAGSGQRIDPGFTPPGLGQVLSFAIKAFFTVAALAALFYLLLGAFAWISSGGNKENVEKARDKIQAAIIGLVIIVGVIAVAVSLETFVFNKKVCFGFTCDVIIPSLIQ